MLHTQFSTGLPGLDRIFKGIIPGDNLVWQIDALEDFVPFAIPFCQQALRQGRKLVYFRFAEHPPLIPEELGVPVKKLETREGFEQFIKEIHSVIREKGSGAYFIFDCLSTLADAWCSDRMLGNFFMLTCPYVLDRQAMAYFPLLRNGHSFHATRPISMTTQILVDVYRHRGSLYVHPLKVQHRYSPTMHMLHVWRGDDFQPVYESATIAEILTSMPWAGLESVRFRLGKWNRSFLQAEELCEEVQRGHQSPEEAARILPELLHMIISRDSRVLQLVANYFTLSDVLAIWKRMIGTGLIGGKSLGMLLARAILLKSDPAWNDLLEAHDSFFIGSDVFYSFLVENGCWWLRQKQQDPDTFLNEVDEARRRILMGVFPEHIVKEFAEMLDYFGQSPIIVRSSSLLEDNYGNAFAGKYESEFCANQGPHEKRLQDFISAVKTIYASSMSEKALRYRAQRKLLDRDEQMSLLVQRVSGQWYGGLFYPHVAGVGLSLNPYVWNKAIDPQAGVVRLVFGLGTRAVNRSDDDYTRVVALNIPNLHPESDFDEMRYYAQHKVDVLDLAANQLVSKDFREVIRESPGLPLPVVATGAGGGAPLSADSPLAGNPDAVLSFDHLLSQTSFVADMRKMLKILHEAYDYPVDMEFTANFSSPDQYKINLLQCRPLQVAAQESLIELPPAVSRENLLLEAHGAVIGASRALTLDRLVYVSPATYGKLPVRERYTVARLIGRILHLGEPAPAQKIMLLGPGRWGTSTPSLGVPVVFAEIDNVSVLCEIVAMRDDLIPDVSLGTHFFNDLVEMDILYLALFPQRKQNYWNQSFFEESPNRLAQLLPDAAQWAHVIRVIDAKQPSSTPGEIQILSDTFSQRVVCFTADAK
jgi:pyruvate,water dikinase